MHVPETTAPETAGSYAPLGLHDSPVTAGGQDGQLPVLNEAFHPASYSSWYPMDVLPPPATTSGCYWPARTDILPLIPRNFSPLMPSLLDLSQSIASPYSPPSMLALPASGSSINTSNTSNTSFDMAFTMSATSAAPDMMAASPAASPAAAASPSSSPLLDVVCGTLLSVGQDSTHNGSGSSESVGLVWQKPNLDVDQLFIEATRTSPSLSTTLGNIIVASTPGSTPSSSTDNATTSQPIMQNIALNHLIPMSGAFARTTAASSFDGLSSLHSLHGLHGLHGLGLGLGPALIQAPAAFTPSLLDPVRFPEQHQHIRQSSHSASSLVKNMFMPPSVPIIPPIITTGHPLRPSLVALFAGDGSKHARPSTSPPVARVPPPPPIPEPLRQYQQQLRQQQTAKPQQPPLPPASTLDAVPASQTTAPANPPANPPAVTPPHSPSKRKTPCEEDQQTSKTDAKTETTPTKRATTRPRKRSRPDPADAAAVVATAFTPTIIPVPITARPAAEAAASAAPPVLPSSMAAAATKRSRPRRPRRPRKRSVDAEADFRARLMTVALNVPASMTQSSVTPVALPVRPLAPALSPAPAEAATATATKTMALPVPKVPLASSTPKQSRTMRRGRVLVSLAPVRSTNELDNSQHESSNSTAASEKNNGGGDGKVSTT